MSGLRKEDRIFVAGHNGLVGSSLLEELKHCGYQKIVTKSRAELNLLNQDDVLRFYAEQKLDVIFIAAARVGGIHANNTYRADFIAENLQIQSNLITGAHKYNVRRLVFLGSSCIYPVNSPQPLKEEYLLTGTLELTNQPYAIAKIAGLELVNAYRQQYTRNWFSVMPSSLYGPRDNFHPENSHVLPALIRRFEEARLSDEEEVVVWGTGKPMREFMFSLDCARAIVKLAEKDDLSGLFKSKFQDTMSHINVGAGEEVRISDLATMVAQAVGFKGKIKFDPSKPDGAPRKILDCSILQETCPMKLTSLSEGINSTLEYFRSLNRVSQLSNRSQELGLPL